MVAQLFVFILILCDSFENGEIENVFPQRAFIYCFPPLPVYIDLGTCHYLAGRGGGRKRGGGESYQFFKQGSQKIATLPTSIQSYFLKHYCPELNYPVR